MKHLVNHPFPYFDLLVTRDPLAIKQQVEAKYKQTKRWENHTTEGGRYKEFTAFALLLAAPIPGKPGEYNADVAKVDRIVTSCLEEVEKHLLGFVWPDNTIHKDIPDRVVQWAKDVLKIDPAMSRPFLDDVIRRRNIRIVTEKPKRQPRPVTNLRATGRDGTIELRWDLPSQDCDEVIITRSNRGMPLLADRVHKFHGVSWTDQDVVPGETYCYGLYSVVDNTPGAMESIRIAARTSVKGFRAWAEGRKTVLEWTLPENVENVVILRSPQMMTGIVDEQGRLVVPPQATQLAEIGPEARYEDARVQLGQTYYYAVTARHGVDCYSPSEIRSVTVSTAPSPPQNLRGTAAQEVIHLAWEAPAGVDSPRFRIERTETAALGSPDSNSTRLRPHGTSYDDRNTVAGTAYWYHVWTINADGVESLQPATVGPILAHAEVSELRVHVAEQQVELTWKQPNNLVRVEVRRGVDQVPPAPLQPGVAIPGSVLVPVVQPGRLIDTNLTNDRTYGYRVSCVFRRPDGSEMVTRGEAVLATPAVPPPTIHNIAFEAIGQGLALQWDNPDGAQVVVLRTDTLPSGLSVNQCVPLAAVDTLGKRVVGVLSDSVTDPAPDPASPFFLLFTVNRSQARLCGINRYLEVSGAQAQEVDDALHVNWRWPPDCKAVLFRVLSKATSDPSAVRGKRIDRQASHRSGGVKLPLSKLPNGEHRFHIQCLAPEGDPRYLAGPGVTVRHHVRRMVTISWHLRRRTSLFRKARTELLVHPERKLESVERLVLVGKINRVPRDIDDGDRLLEWHPTGAEECLDLPVKSSGDGVYFCRLFAEPGDGITIIDPDIEECQL